MFPFIRIKTYVGPCSCALAGEEIKKSYTRSIAFFDIVNPSEAAFSFLFSLKYTETRGVQTITSNLVFILIAFINCKNLSHLYSAWEYISCKIVLQVSDKGWKKVYEAMLMSSVAYKQGIL